MEILDTTAMTAAAIILALAIIALLAMLWRDARRRREAGQWQMNHMGMTEMGMTEMGMSETPHVRASRKVC